MTRKRNKKSQKEEEQLIEPILDKDKLNVIKSVIREVKEFYYLSNSARLDIAEKLVAKEYKKEIIMTKDINTAHIFIIISGTIKLISSEKKFKAYLKENNIEYIQKENNHEIHEDKKNGKCGDAFLLSIGETNHQDTSNGQQKVSSH